MHTAIEQMLKKYQCHSQLDYLNAIKEIFQEIALLGLWRAKFYEKAAFYGGSSLRILYGLDRFSEDLDFTLLAKDKKFNLTSYNQAVIDELKSFGFDVTVVQKEKSITSNIQSAFLKADSKTQLLVINAPSAIARQIHSMQTIKIKMEVDINPPLKFSTEAKTLLQPIPFAVKTLALPDLFAGKIHALLCRPWVKRTKGRDWYDFVWYIANKVPVNLDHLQERLIQTDTKFSENILTQSALINLLENKISKTDFKNAKQDVLPFLKDPQSVELWDVAFFKSLLSQLEIDIA